MTHKPDEMLDRVLRREEREFNRPMTDTTRSEAATLPYRDRVLALISKEIAYAEKHLRPSDAEWMKGLWSLVLTEPENKAASVQAEPTERKPFKMLVDQDWVRRAAELEDGCEVEAGTMHPEAPNAASIPAPGQVSEDDENETYEIGKRDGYEEAMADAARAVNIDPEYRFSTDPERNQPDPAALLVRITERIAALQASQTASVEEDAINEAVHAISQEICNHIDLAEPARPRHADYLKTHNLATQAAAIRAGNFLRSYLQAAGLPAPVPEWHSMEEIPVTPLGTVRNFAVAFRSKERGSVWVEEAHFLNAFPLTPRDDNADEIEGADDDGNVPFTGWHERFGDEDEPFYQGIQMDNPYTEVLGWAEMPKHPLAASPRATGETGTG
jgi:hypothetical protein